MHFTILKENLLKTTALVNQAINPRPALPVLGNLLLEVESNKLTMTGTDLQTTIKADVPVKMSRPGKTTVSARLFIDFCQSVSLDQVECKKEKDNVVVMAGSAKATIPTIGDDEFPTTGEFESESSLSFTAKKFVESVTQTTICAAPEEGRPILTGVLLEADGKKMNLVVTDGYRLAKKELKTEEQMQVVIPARALREAAKAVADQADTDVKLLVNRENNQVRLAMKNFSLTTRLLDGSYPNYEQIIPSSFVTEAFVNTKDLGAAIKLTALFARDVGNVVKLSFESNAIQVNASTAQVGEAQTKVAAKIKGDKTKIAFNSRFLTDLLGTLKSKEVSISLSGLTSAALIKGVDEKDLIYIVMPVRTQT